MENRDNPIFRINEKYDDLYTKEKEIADLILDQPQAVMNSKLKEISKMAGVSEATVVRFCQQLGYSGYSELKLEMAKSSYSISKYEEDNSKDEYRSLSHELYETTLSLLTEYGKIIDYNKIKGSVK